MSASVVRSPSSMGLTETLWQPHRHWYLQHPALNHASANDVVIQWWMHQSSHYPPAWFRPAAVAALIGLFMGAMTMTGLLSFSYPNPINVFYWLGMFVFLPWLILLMATALKRWWSSRPTRWRPMVPDTMASKVSPIPAFVGQAASESSQPMFWQSWLLTPMWKHLPEKVLSPLLFWLNQCLALGFLIGGLMVFLGLLIMQDLAFGWSSTLTISNHSVEGLVQVLSWPWQAWWQDAVPSSDLIRQTRFFRLLPDSPTDVYRFGDWWPFLMAALLFYGLIPRALVASLAYRRLNKQIQAACLTDSLLSAFYRYISSPQLDTGSDEPALQNPDAVIPVDKPEHHLSALSVDAFSALVHQQRVILWGNHDVAALLNDFSVQSLTILGGDRDYGDDVQALEALLADAPAALVWIASGWEPPMAELQDFSSMVPTACAQQLILLSDEHCPVDNQSWLHFVERRMPNTQCSGQIAQELLRK